MASTYNLVTSICSTLRAEEGGSLLDRLVERSNLGQATGGMIHVHDVKSQVQFQTAVETLLGRVVGRSGLLWVSYQGPLTLELPLMHLVAGQVVQVPSMPYVVCRAAHSQVLDLMARWAASGDLRQGQLGAFAQAPPLPF